MIVTTSQSIEGKTISEYLGVISAVHLQKVSIRAGADFWNTGVSAVIEELKCKAAALGAEAVIAVNIMPEAGQQFRAYGTAVKF